jgi:hypothetical protein
MEGLPVAFSAAGFLRCYNCNARAQPRSTQKSTLHLAPPTQQQHTAMAVAAVAAGALQHTDRDSNWMRMWMRHWHVRAAVRYGLPFFWEPPGSWSLRFLQRRFFS